MTMQFLYEELVDVEARVKTLDTRIRQICRQNENCQRILKIPGVGELTATAMVAAVSDPGQFRNGRHMSAWLGLVPRQSSSGDKQTLLGISKRGDRYLRTLLIHGARLVLSNYKDRDNAYNRWIGRKMATLSHNKAEHILLPSHGSQLRRSLEIWFQKKNINPFIVADLFSRFLDVRETRKEHCAPMHAMQVEE